MGLAGVSSQPGQTTVNQHSQRTDIDRSSFNVARGETVRFSQPDASTITLNRISDVNPVIDGTITANGIADRCAGHRPRLAAAGGGVVIAADSIPPSADIQHWERSPPRHPNR